MSHIVDLHLQYRSVVEATILASSADHRTSIFGAMQVKFRICVSQSASSAQLKNPKRRRAADVPALTGSFDAHR